MRVTSGRWLRIAIMGVALLWSGPAHAAAPQKAVLRRLSSEASQLRGRYGPILAAGLQQDAHSITPAELELVARMARSPGVASVVYMDRHGQVRWSEDLQLISLPMADYQKQTGAILQAAAEVLASTAPCVRLVPGAPIYEVAIPILFEGDFQGVLDLWVRRDGLFGLVSGTEPGSGPSHEVPVEKPKSLRASPSKEESPQAQQHYLSGMIYFEKGDHEKALQEWEMAHKLDPENQDVAAGLARVRTMLGRSPTATDAIPLQSKPVFDKSEARSEDQHRAQQHYLSGVVYYDKGDYSKARAEWSEALRIDPDNVDAATGLSRVDRLVTPDDAKNCVDLYQSRRYEDAASACEICLERDPDSAACMATRRLLEGRVP